MNLPQPNRTAMLPLRAILRTLPARVHAEILGRLFNHLMQGQMAVDQLQELEGRSVALQISDTATRLAWRIHAGRLQPLGGREPCDTQIRGSLADFWLLASRGEDPDTLFFNRRLSIEGNTEVGLTVKNILDAHEFELDLHLEAVLGEALGRRVFALLQRLPRSSHHSLGAY